jgi:transcriptional regulator with XRE-family HTH domain
MRYTVCRWIMSFRETILREAERQGLSGYVIGKRSGVPIRTVQAYLSGRTDLAGRRIERIASALGLELRPMRRRKAKGR